MDLQVCEWIMVAMNTINNLLLILSVILGIASLDTRVTVTLCKLTYKCTSTVCVYSSSLAAFLNDIINGLHSLGVISPRKSCSCRSKLCGYT